MIFFSTATVFYHRGRKLVVQSLCGVCFVGSFVKGAALVGVFTYPLILVRMWVNKLLRRIADLSMTISGRIRK